MKDGERGGRESSRGWGEEGGRIREQNLILLALPCDFVGFQLENIFSLLTHNVIMCRRLACLAWLC